MRAVKGNREYMISEEQKDHYLKEEFDIYDETGALIESGKGKMITQEAYDALKKEMEEVKGLSVSDEAILPIMKEYAGLKGIDIGSATTVKGILKKIGEAGDR